MSEFAPHIKGRLFDRSAINKLWNLSNLSVISTRLCFVHPFPLPAYMIMPSKSLEKNKHYFLLNQQFLFKRHSKPSGRKVSDSSKIYTVFYIMLDTAFRICMNAQITSQNNVFPVKPSETNTVIHMH